MSNGQDKLDAKLLHESQVLENLKNELTILQATYGFFEKVGKRPHFKDEVLDSIIQKLRPYVIEHKLTKV